MPWSLTWNPKKLVLEDHSSLGTGLFDHCQMVSSLLNTVKSYVSDIMMFHSYSLDHHRHHAVSYMASLYLQQSFAFFRKTSLECPGWGCFPLFFASFHSSMFLRMFPFVVGSPRMPAISGPHQWSVWPVCLQQSLRVPVAIVPLPGSWARKSKRRFSGAEKQNPKLVYTFSRG